MNFTKTKTAFVQEQHDISPRIVSQRLIYFDLFGMIDDVIYDDQILNQ